ncbi:kinase-like domain-containing protein [Gigaspora rosea]|uniref:Kinase-like domain-containing protein n=1 Tax=Gigaspora rosea TaxID=44941 RepID=A0A397UNB3_9GLOM|nr:kinase-like domain-containing protein [Gigaspora rosea]
MSSWFKDAVKNKHIKSFEYEAFENKKLIGNGGFGKVYSAYSKDIDQTIALKRLHHSIIHDDENSFHEFVREIKIITEVDHNINIIRFFGIVKDPKEKYYMVLQYANSGNLRGYLQSHFSKLDWPTKIKMAKEISSGIKCLHNANIVHRDLHDKNILVDNGRMMIADFGLSKSLENTSKSISGGVWTFTDPSYLANQYMFKRGKPSDIYSLGLLFWELSSGFPPFKNVSDVAEIILDLISGKRETPINGTPIDFMNLYCDAWNGDPSSRPNIDEIYHKLNSIQIDSVYHSALEKAILDQGINCYSFNEFSDLKKISIEESDTVYKSIWKTCNKTVALKCLKVNDSDLSDMMIQEFINKKLLTQILLGFME